MMYIIPEKFTLEFLCGNIFAKKIVIFDYIDVAMSK